MLTVNCIIVGCSKQKSKKENLASLQSSFFQGCCLQVRVTELRPKLFYFFNIYNNAQETVKPGPCNLSAVVLDCWVERFFHTNKKTVRDHTRLSIRHHIYTFCKRVIAGRYSSAINACPLNHVNAANKADIQLYMCTPLNTFFFPLFHFLLFRLPVPAPALPSGIRKIILRVSRGANNAWSKYHRYRPQRKKKLLGMVPTC